MAYEENIIRPSISSHCGYMTTKPANRLHPLANNWSATNSVLYSLKSQLPHSYHLLFIRIAILAAVLVLSGKFANAQYPVVAGTASSAGAWGVSHVVTLPAGVQAGDLLLVFWSDANYNSISVTFPSGWISVYDYYHPAGNYRYILMYKIATGPEGSITVLTGNNERSAHNSYRIAAGTYTGIPIPSSNVPGSSQYPDPANLTSGFGAVPTLWIAAAHAYGYPGTPASPTNYSNIIVSPYFWGFPWNIYAKMATARRELTAASEDPGQFDLSPSSVYWGANTVAIQAARPTITLSPNPSVCTGATSANLTYSGTTNNPDQYIIDWDPAAEAQGFVDVPYTTLPASPIVLAVPAGAATGTYNATLKVSNSTISPLYESINYNISLTINALPTCTITGPGEPVCPSTSYVYTAPAGMSSYSWSVSGSAAISGSSILQNVTIVTGAVSSGTFTINLTIVDINGCSSNCSEEVDIEDADPPSITCPPDVIATTIEACLGLISVDDPVYSDNCGVQSLVWSMSGATTANSPPTGINLIGTYPFNQGVTNVQYIVTDNVGNTDNCSFTVTVPFSPVSLTIGSNSPICEGETLDLTSVVSGGTPGYDYSWTGPDGFTSADPNPSIPGATPLATGEYFLIVTDVNNCTATDSIDVTVNPSPVITAVPVSQEVCHNTATTPIVFSSNVGGTVFNWTNDSPSIGLAASGSGNIPSFIAQNPGIDPITATIYVMPVANGCDGEPLEVYITVNPIPVLSSSLDPLTVCSGLPFFYQPTSETGGTIFTWTRAFVPGITPNTGSGTGDINETLINSTSGPRTVHYIITLSANGCANPTQYDLAVTVNPVPGFTSSLGPYYICSENVFHYTPSSNIPGATFAWSRASVPGIVEPPSSGTGGIDEILTNITPLSIKVTYVYSVSYEDCTNPATFNVEVWVKPIPVLTSTLTPPGICSGNVFSYTPTSSTPGTIFNWSRAAVPGILEPANNGTGNPNEVLTNTTVNPVTVIYVYTLTASGCTNPTTYNVSVVVNPMPVLTSSPTPPGICSGTLFSYEPMSNVTGTTFAWTRASVTGILPLGTSGTGNPNEVLTNTTALPISVRYVYTLTANGCTNPTTFNVDVMVNPKPLLSSSLTPPAICSGTLFSYNPTSNTPGTTFAWFRPAVMGISNPPASGMGNPNEVLVNTTNGTLNVTYIYTLTANGCINVQNVVVGVKPTPTVTPVSNKVYCHGTVVPVIVITGPVPGTTFAWVNSNTAIGLGPNGTGNIPSFTATNTTDNPIVATISITPTANGCTGPVSSFTITVYPNAVLTSSLTPPPICSGTEFSYEPTSNVTGTTFAWFRAAVAGISNPAASGTGNPHEVLINTTALPIAVTYVYTLTANGCTNPATYSVVVIVNPIPTLTSTLNPQPICSNTLFSYNPTSGTPGTVFNWNRPAVPGISNPAGSGTGNPNEILVNTTFLPVVVTYIYTLTANGCSNVQNVTVTVKPTPTADPVADQDYCIGDVVPEAVLTGPVAGTTFTWTNDNTGIGLGASGSGNVPSFVATNATGAPIVATITVIPLAASCTGPPMIYTITVYPSATVNPINDQEYCNGEAAPATILTGPIPGTTFTWVNSNPSIGLPAAGSGNVPAFITTNPTNVTEVATVTITPMYGSCPGVQSSYTITVYPTPTTDPVSNQVHCEGDLVPETILTGSVAGTVFNWVNDNTAIGLGASGTGNIPSFTATNTTPNPLLANITITPTANGCNGAPSIFTITVNPIPELSSTLTPPPLCSEAQFYYEPTSLTPGVVFDWSRAAVPGISNPPATGTGTIDEYLENTTFSPIAVTYEITLTANGCINAQNVVVVVAPIPTVVLPDTALTVCSHSPFTFTPTGPVAGTIFSWSRAAVPGISNPPATGIGDINETLINTTAASIAVTYVYSMSTPECANPISEDLVVVVVPAPVVTASASETMVCIGQAFDLFSTSNLGTSLPSVLLSENFNGPTYPWTTINNSTGGNPAAAAWTLRPDGYVYGGNTFHSNDNSQFYLSNSRAQGSGGLTRTFLVSPVMNTVGYTTLELSFWHYYRNNTNSGNDYGYVQVSTDGVVWTTVRTYTSTQGGSSNFRYATVNLSSYTGNPTLYVQFYYFASYDYYWAIDNVTVTGTSPTPACVWTSIPPGFTSTDNNPTGVTQTENTSYIVTYVDLNTNCPGRDTVTVDMAPVANASITADYCAIPGKVVLTANPPPPGHTYLWSTGETTQVIIIDIVGIYSVTVTNAFGCSVTAFLNVSNEYVLNGDFELGNQDFFTDYQYRADIVGVNNELLVGGPGGSGEGLYGVGVSGQNYHPNFWGFDHTTGTGNYMLVNGWGNTFTIWEEGPFVILPNTIYYFSAWAMSLNNVPPFAQLQFEIETVEYGAELAGVPATVPPGVNNNANPWLPAGRFYGSWNSRLATSAIIRIVNLVPNLNGNDFGLDDISFGTLAPTSATIDPQANNGNGLCEGDTLFLEANLTGGMLPYDFSWTGPAGFMSDLENPIVPNPTLANAGTYYLTFNDGYGCPPLTDSATLVMIESPTATISPSDTVCLNDPEPLVTFTGFDGAPPYTFYYTLNGGPVLDTTTISGNSVSLSVPTNVVTTYVFALVRVADTNGCDRLESDTCRITVADLPDCLITGEDTLCPYSAGNIYEGPAGMTTYFWSIIGNGTISGPNNLSTVTVTAGSNCSSIFTLMLLVTNNESCEASCSMDVMVQDITLPVWTTTAGSLDSTLLCSDVAGLAYMQSLAPSATDNCSASLFLVKTPGSFVPGSCANAGTYTNTWLVTDTCGNTVAAPFTQVITIIDTVAPTWTTPAGALNVNLECSDTSGLAAAQALLPVAVDNCDLTIVAVKTPGAFVPGTCANSGTYTNTFVATDDCGNSGTIYTQVITINDNTQPVITCPANISIDCDESVDPANTGTATAIDNCDSVPDITYSDVTIPGACPDAYTIQRTWTATDDCGNSENCMQVITVQDVSPPDLVGVPADTTVSCDAIPLPPTVTAVDNCDLSVPVVFNEVNNVVNGCGTIERTWTATDDCGNVGTATQLITVIDTVSPVLTGVPNDTTVSCESVPPPAVVTVTDNCDNTVTVLFEETYNTVFEGCGEILRTWSALDYCGNIVIETQTITVEDGEAPTWLTGPGALNVTLQCDDSIGISVAQTFEPVATDNCDPTLVPEKTSGPFIPGSCPQAGSYTNTWIAIDNCGDTSNVYTQVITIIDDVAPAWDQAANFLNRNLACADTAGLAAALALAPTATDNCGTVTIVLESDVTTSSGCTGSFIITRKWSATDNCGNTNALQYTQVIVVADDVAPVWDQAAGELDASISCDDPGGLIAALALSPTATDECNSGIIISLVSDNTIPGVCPASYTRIRSWTAEDGCGNINPVEYTQTISVYDTVEPVFYNIPADVTISCDDPVPPVPGNIIAFDNCSDDVTGNILFDEIFDPDPACPNGGTITRTWSVDDGCGNIANAIQVITVYDTASPVITCPPDSLNILADPGQPYATMSLLPPVYSDNCSAVIDIILTWTMTGATTGSGTGIIPDPYIFNIGTTFITYTVTDECGNTQDCQFIVEVDPNYDPPEIDCPANILQNTDPDLCTAVISPGFPVKISGSEPITYDWLMSGATAGSGTGPITPDPYTFNLGVTTIQWIATNMAGADTCYQTVTVVDVQPPEFILPADTVHCVEDIIDALFNPTGVYPIDDLTYPRPEYFLLVTGDTRLDIINIWDNCTPLINLVITWEFDYGNDGSIDDTGTGLLSEAPPNFIPVGINRLYYIVTDASGNATTRSFIVFVHPRPDILDGF